MMKKEDLNAPKTESLDAAEEEMTVELDLDDGRHVTCSVVTILTVTDQDYIVLLPLDEKGQNEDGEVWFYRYFENEENPNEEPVLKYIEDDDEYEAVGEAFDEYLDSVEFDEMVDDTEKEPQ
ncbi:MAG: DUF1292 domain-containing protein [Blautia sp.]|nr:DUF1292 domain-containing protein [Blautia sp.]MCM1200610.1 DUF1292 domain-containing protein [Bacteroides fragilis]